MLAQRREGEGEGEEGEEDRGLFRVALLSEAGHVRIDCQSSRLVRITFLLLARRHSSRGTAGLNLNNLLPGDDQLLGKSQEIKAIPSVGSFRRSRGSRSIAPRSPVNVEAVSLSLSLSLISLRVMSEKASPCRPMNLGGRMLYIPPPQK